MIEKNSDENKSLVRIAEAAKICGLSRQTIHYYLMLGLVTESAQTAGGHRLFDSAAIKRIKLIHKLNHSGYTLREIRETFLKGDSRQ
jgi:DNA-binding transcriptional MerR regulator